MDITFAPKGILQIDHARIIYRNFAGMASKYNGEGDRNFALVVPTREQADALIDEGWNVRIKDPREEGEEPFMFLPVKVKFNGWGPNIYLETGRSRNRLDEDTVKDLDDIDIIDVDLDISPHHWEVRGETGQSAYLRSMLVRQNIDRFAAEYAREEHPEE